MGKAETPTSVSVSRNNCGRYRGGPAGPRRATAAKGTSRRLWRFNGSAGGHRSGAPVDNHKDCRLVRGTTDAPDALTDPAVLPDTIVEMIGHRDYPCPCPTHVTVTIRAAKAGGGTAAFGTTGGGCPLAAACTTAKTGRTISVGRYEAELTRARATQQDGRVPEVVDTQGAQTQIRLALSKMRLRKLGLRSTPPPGAVNRSSSGPRPAISSVSGPVRKAGKGTTRRLWVLGVPKMTLPRPSQVASSMERRRRWRSTRPTRRAAASPHRISVEART